MDSTKFAPFNLLTTTASDLQVLLATSRLTSTDLVGAYLKQIARTNHYLKAVISTAPKHDLYEQARNLDAERAQGKTRSPLHGIPILLKDNIATHPNLGMDTTAGSFALAGSRPRKNADLVDKLLAAGLIILGKANLSELSWFKGDVICGWSAVGGQSQSAYVRGGFVDDGSPASLSNPGGSSSGSAIAVSAGMAPLSIGTDTISSLILPANRADLYTIKPTIGVVSQQGLVPINSYCDAAGPMAKSVLDEANVLDIIADPTSPGRPANGYASVLVDSWSHLKVGVLDPEVWKYEDDYVKSEPSATKQMNEAFLKAYEVIKARAKEFHKFVTLPIGSDLEYKGTPATRVLFAGMFKQHFEEYTKDLDSSHVYTLEELIDFNRNHAEEELPKDYPRQDRLERALNHGFTKEDIAGALAHARKIGREDGIDKTLADYDIDVIIGPAESPMPDIAAAAGKYTQRYPIATLPLGYLDLNGRPFGMAVLASGGQDALLIKVQSAWEATFGPRQPPDVESFAVADDGQGRETTPTA